MVCQNIWIINLKYFIPVVFFLFADDLWKSWSFFSCSSVIFLYFLFFMLTTGDSVRGSSEYAGFILKNQQFLSYCREIIYLSHRQPWLSFLNPSMKSSYRGLSYSFSFTYKKNHCTYTLSSRHFASLPGRLSHCNCNSYFISIETKAACPYFPTFSCIV